MPKIIEFPPGAHCELSPLSVSFEAIVDGKKVACSVTYELLTRVFQSGRSDEELLDAFTKNRAAIEKVARRLIENEQIDANGEVQITTTTYRR
jgi:hypothetical protein